MDVALLSPLGPTAVKPRAPVEQAEPSSALQAASSAPAAAEKVQPPVADRQTQHEPVEQAVLSIKEFVQTIRRDLNFTLDDSTGRVVVKVTDGASGEVISQMPTEEALRLAESLEEVRSLLFKAEA